MKEGRAKRRGARQSEHLGAVGDGFRRHLDVRHYVLGGGCRFGLADRLPS